ncbi:hypothetical protein QBC46DRAFT_436245 [Diplogelasinospora grovesii]|uniref:Uncharacterized protein n=1 Tax=Diplogelasinospora grovesii TaxID=303347 RepID=A0AAN6N9Y5_9PEZI|nr:hypothetical protein QBC46DRAFT_436245 [Diplogelasinospora grovesii]
MTENRISAADFEELVTKGRELYAQLLDSIQARGYTHVQPPRIAPRYVAELGQPKTLDIPLFRDKEVKYKAGQPRDEYIQVQVENGGPSRHSDGSKPYEHYIHKDGRAILSTLMSKGEDRYFYTGQRMYWSDLMAVSVSRVMAAHGGNAKALETIWMVKILNNTTTGAVLEELERRRRERGPIWWELCADDDGFFALLGTDHGKGSARMLATYPKMFGRKTISRVGVFKKNLCWFVEEAAVPEPRAAAPEVPSKLSRKERRKKKKSLSQASEGQAA